jgi:hypothetical protein
MRRRQNVIASLFAAAVVSSAGVAWACCQTDADCSAANGGDPSVRCVTTSDGEQLCARLSAAQCTAPPEGTPCGPLSCSGDTPICVELMSGVIARPPYGGGIRYSCVATPPTYSICFAIAPNTYECQGI